MARTSAGRAAISRSAFCRTRKFRWKLEATTLCTCLLYTSINDRLILPHLLLQVPGLPEAAVDDALGLLGVDVLVLPVDKVLERLAACLQSVGRGVHARFCVAPGVGGLLLSLRVSALASRRRFGLLPKDDILV